MNSIIDSRLLVKYVRIVATVMFCIGMQLFAVTCLAGGNETEEKHLSRIELPNGIHPVEFTTTTVTIHSAGGVYNFQVEIAITGPQHRRGLMYRTELAESAGMLFVYPREHQGRLWMFNTYMPLSVAFADADGTIFQITDMEPCGELTRAECERRAYAAARPFRFALEINQGEFTRHGIRVGDRLSYP